MRLVEKDWTTSVIQHKRKYNGWIIVVLILIVVIALAGVLWIANQKLYTAIRHSEQSNQVLTKKLEWYQQELTTVQKNIRMIQEDTAIQDMTHQIEDYMATDDFVVNKIYFYKDTSHQLEYLYIDIYNQPKMESYYSAQGVYTLPDQQVQAKCKQMIDDIQKFYTEGEHLPVWSKKTVVYMTINNYEIGNTIDGKFELTAK